MSKYSNSDPDLQEAIVTALGDIGNDRSFDLLCHAYHSGSKTAVKVEALNAISKFPSPRLPLTFCWKLWIQVAPGF